jgi:hypothetical protein
MRGRDFGMKPGSRHRRVPGVAAGFLDRSGIIGLMLAFAV